VIGKAVASPAQAVAGQRLTVSAKVTRSDTGRSLTQGLASCKPTAGGKAVAHTQAFRAGVARCSFTVPLSATSVRVTFTVRSGGQTATKNFAFAVRPAPKPSLSIGDVTVNEGNSGTTTMSLPVNLSKVERAIGLCVVGDR
jgi:hypothetical protein